jgi:hypothetical protein
MRGGAVCEVWRTLNHPPVVDTFTTPDGGLSSSAAFTADTLVNTVANALTQRAEQFGSVGDG